ncbi:cerebellin-1-like [Paralichthys olivaceus]|uniref:cerebellin-1-like n=1 Tax=Paralichthys olivaceus TaxID=8255 RepID=UPI003751ECCB
MRATVCTLIVLGLLWDSVRAEIPINSLKAAAVAWTGDLPCRKWDCECALRHHRGCCCATHELQEAEDQLYVTVKDLWMRVSQLSDSALEAIGGLQIAFTAYMSPRENCFGPFTRNTPIPYDVITLNQGSGYNPALGVFTAHRPGVYSFSFSVYCNVGMAGKRLYYRVQLMRNSEAVAATWEDNREDSEDSSSQTVLLPLQQGDQVYVELQSGRQLCGNVMGLNTFSGSLIYPTQA